MDEEDIYADCSSRNGIGIACFGTLDCVALPAICRYSFKI